MRILSQQAHARILACAAAMVLAATVWAAGQTPTTGKSEANAPTGLPATSGTGKSTPQDAAPATTPASAPAPKATTVDKSATQPVTDENGNVLELPPEPALDKAASQPATAQAETTVRISRPGTFEIHFRDSGLREAFELLGTQGHRNIVPTKEVIGKIAAVDLYDVTFKEVLEAVLNSTGYAYQEEGNFIYVMTPEQLQKKLDVQKKLVTRSFTLAYMTAADAKTLITPALSKEGVVAVTPPASVGINDSATDAGGNTLASADTIVVHDYNENIESIAKMIADLDVKPEQILIEATVLRATLNETTALGIDFNTLAGVDFSTLTATTDGLTDMQTPNINVTNTPSGTFRTDFAGAVPSGGASFGFIGKDAAAFVRALESITDTTVLANPKLLIVNKQRGEVMVGNKDGYLTTTVTETQSTQTVQFLETGTHLIVRPFIGRDGYIRMEIHPEDSSGSVPAWWAPASCPARRRRK